MRADQGAGGQASSTAGRWLIRLLSQRIPENSDETDVSLSNRYQNVIGILNELDKFNQKVSASSQTREVAPGDSREVDTLYVGLGAGYYAGPRVASGGGATPRPRAGSGRRRTTRHRRSWKRWIFNNEKTATFAPPASAGNRDSDTQREEEVAASAASTGSTGTESIRVHRVYRVYRIH